MIDFAYHQDQSKAKSVPMLYHGPPSDLCCAKGLLDFNCSWRQESSHLVRKKEPLETAFQRPDPTPIRGTLLDTTAAEALPGILAEAFGPIGHGLIATQATQAGSGGNRQNRGQSMSPPLGSARIGNLSKKGRQRLRA
jgi:hypothetical protein